MEWNPADGSRLQWGILSLLAERDGSLWIGTDSRIGDHYLIAGQARSICHGEVIEFLETWAPGGP